MKRVVLSLLSLVVGAAYVGAARAPEPPAAASSDAHAATAGDASTGGPGDEPHLSRHAAMVDGVVGGAVARTPARDEGWTREDALRRLRAGQAGTYIADILTERDSSISRWPDRSGVPLAVWIQPRSQVTDFAPALVSRVHEAFEEWNALALPVRFAFTSDSAAADVHVRWIDRFTEPISGRTRWSRDDAWFITDATIVLAVHHTQGDALDGSSMRAMALHEIGHLLGLDHTHDARSIMAPMVRVRRLSAADRATARLLYSLPAGPLR